MTRAGTPEATRKKALEVFAKDGATAAAKAAGVHRNTVLTWVRQAGIATQRRQNQMAMIEASRDRWEERRARMIDDMGKVAEKALRAVTDTLDDARYRDAKDCATTMAILVDKAQLLSGGATARNENAVDPSAVVADARGRVVRLVPQRQAQ